MKTENENKGLMEVESAKIGVDVNPSWGNSYNLSNKPGVTNPPDAKDNLVYSWTTIPTTIPKLIWDMYIKTDTKKVYIATGTTSSSDWTILN